MEVIGIRFCTVAEEAESLAGFLGALGLPQRDMEATEVESFPGAVFPAGNSWIEVWKNGPDMPEGVMLQVVVDDADAYAEHARSNGLEPQGPMDAHGERIYFLRAPTGLQMSVQSVLESTSD
ncbi:MAG: hypothetical protein OEM63_01715 [Gammaproteobacteria bacterium]|nr:hypothetical protein [Gammaproteobacteria bacterium]